MVKLHVFDLDAWPADILVRIPDYKMTKVDDPPRWELNR
jgi:hypothetical protein